MVGRVTPNSAAICATVCARLPLSSVSSYICWARVTWRGPSLGFWPPVRPRAREPRRVQITENSAMEPRIWKNMRLRAVEVLMPWSSTTKSTPRDCSCRDSSRRCSKERPSRSASRVWPGRRAKGGRRQPHHAETSGTGHGAPARAAAAHPITPRSGRLASWACWNGLLPSSSLVVMRWPQISTSRRATVRRSTRRRLSGGVMPQPEAPGTIRGLAGVLSLSRRGQSPDLVTPNIRTRRSMS